MKQEEFETAVNNAKTHTSCKGLRLARYNSSDNSFECPWCSKKQHLNYSHFKDALSVKEFFISGLCATCQEEFFE